MNLNKTFRAAWFGTSLFAAMVTGTTLLAHPWAFHSESEAEAQQTASSQDQAIANAYARSLRAQGFTVVKVTRMGGDQLRILATRDDVRRVIVVSTVSGGVVSDRVLRGVASGSGAPAPEIASRRADPEPTTPEDPEPETDEQSQSTEETSDEPSAHKASLIASIKHTLARKGFRLLGVTHKGADHLLFVAKRGDRYRSLVVALDGGVVVSDRMLAEAEALVALGADDDHGGKFLSADVAAVVLGGSEGHDGRRLLDVDVDLGGQQEDEASDGGVIDVDVDLGGLFH